MKTRYALVLLGVLGCEKNNSTPPRADVPATRAAADVAPSAADLVIPELPGAALLAIRGSNLRKVLNLIAPGVPTRLALGQAAPGITPGLGEHGVDIDPDAPFSAILAPSSADTPNGQVNVTVAWPLRPGMEVVQNAQAGRGYRDAGDGLYEPTGSAQDVLLGGRDGGAASTP